MTDINQETGEIEQDVSHALVAEDNSLSSTLNRSELAQQLATAKANSRSVSVFLKEAKALVALNADIAESCMYSLKRGKKLIQGPSARFAEIVVSRWRNVHAGARVIDEGKEFVTAQGAFWDLESNVKIVLNVQRRITDSEGRRYNTDMVGVTANAACSIALRNAILKGIPKAFWESVYDHARTVAIGDASTLETRKDRAIKKLAAYGLTTEQILQKLDRKGTDDITLDDLEVLFGIFTAIKDGDTSIEQAFSATDVDIPSMSESKLTDFIAGIEESGDVDKVEQMRQIGAAEAAKAKDSAAMKKINEAAAKRKAELQVKK